MHQFYNKILVAVTQSDKQRLKNSITESSNKILNNNSKIYFSTNTIKKKKNSNNTNYQSFTTKTTKNKISPGALKRDIKRCSKFFY